MPTKKTTAKKTTTKKTAAKKTTAKKVAAKKTTAKKAATKKAPAKKVTAKKLVAKSRSIKKPITASIKTPLTQATAIVEAAPTLSLEQPRLRKSLTQKKNARYSPPRTLNRRRN